MADASGGSLGCISEAAHSQPGSGHTIYLYLLNGLTIDRPNQVWASDLCYVLTAKGFIYLTVIMDWYSRRVRAWRVSNSLDAEPGIAALEEAVAGYGVPGIVNTDQGAQDTSEAYTGPCCGSMKARAAWMGKAGGSTRSLWKAYGAV